MERMKAAELFIEKIKKDYPEDVACVVIMGSTIYDDTHEKSDLDMYFIVKTERGYALQDVFIIDGVGYDFWAVSWEFIETLANHERRITSILTEGKVLYYGNDEDKRKFQELKKRALDREEGERFFNRGETQLKEALYLLHQLEQMEALHQVRRNAAELVGAVTYGIALLNRTTIKRGRGKLKKEILQMEIVPEGFGEDFDRIFLSNEPSVIKNASRSMVSQFDNSLKQEMRKSENVVAFKESFGGYYEELINFYNKLERACRINDPYTALIVSTEITNEIENGFKGTRVSPDELPNLLEAYRPTDLSNLATVGKLHQNALLKILEREKVPIKIYKGFSELKEELDKR